MTILVPCLALFVSMFAWAIKDFTAKMMFHTFGIIFWLVSAFLMYNVTFIGNTFMNEAVFLIGIIGTLVEIVGLVSTAIAERKKQPTYEEEKAAYSQKIAKLTKRPQEKWYE